MLQEKQTIELTVDEISMIMDGLNRAEIRYSELCCPAAVDAYRALWLRFYKLKYQAI